MDVVVGVGVDGAGVVETGARTAATGGSAGVGAGTGVVVVVAVVVGLAAGFFAAGFFTAGFTACFFCFGAVVRCVTTAERARMEAGRCAVIGLAGFVAGAWTAGCDAVRCAVVGCCVVFDACGAVAVRWLAERCSDAMCVVAGVFVVCGLDVVCVCGFAGWARGGAASIVVPPASAIRTGLPPSAGPSSRAGRLTRTARAVATSAPASA
jgi:hypothetical protein